MREKKVRLRVRLRNRDVLGGFDWIRFDRE